MVLDSQTTKPSSSIVGTSPLGLSLRNSGVLTTPWCLPASMRSYAMPASSQHHSTFCTLTESALPQIFSMNERTRWEGNPEPILRYLAAHLRERLILLEARSVETDWRDSEGACHAAQHRELLGRTGLGCPVACDDGRAPDARAGLCRERARGQPRALR